MKSNPSKDAKIPFNKALVWILSSVLLIVGSSTLGVLFYQHVKELHGSDDAYRIVAVVQTTSEPEALKTLYLAELLDLSIDQPVNLYRLNCKDARRKLLASPLIKEAKVKKVKPGTVYIDYRMRKPAAFLADLSNTAIDLEGVPFPFKPFFTPKRLPEIYLGLPLHNEEGEPVEEGRWGTALRGKEALLALSLLQEMKTNYPIETMHLKRVDVSKAYASSCGERQIVIVVEERAEQSHQGRSILVVFPRLLRLSTEGYQQGLANYKVLREHLSRQPIKLPDQQIAAIVKQPMTIIDLRLSQLGFMSQVKE